VCFISESSNSVRSVVKPALHVGKHSFGGVGCFAWAGRGGIAAGLTSGRGKGCAQPLSSSASALSISTSLNFTFAGFIGNLLCCRDAALFLVAGLLHSGHYRCQGLRFLLFELQLGRVQTPRLQGGEGRNGGQSDEQGAGDHWVIASTMALATSHLRSW
jgi:hypothetical protein